MENITKLTDKDVSTNHDTQVVLRLDCGMCWNEETFIADSLEECLRDAHENGWRYINSDEFALMGHYCGCDYMDK